MLDLAIWWTGLTMSIQTKEYRAISAAMCGDFGRYDALTRQCEKWNLYLAQNVANTSNGAAHYRLGKLSELGVN